MGSYDMNTQPTLQEFVTQFKDNNYIEIGYIDGIRRVYPS